VDDPDGLGWIPHNAICRDPERPVSTPSVEKRRKRRKRKKKRKKKQKGEKEREGEGEREREREGERERENKKKREKKKQNLLIPWNEDRFRGTILSLSLTLG